MSQEEMELIRRLRSMRPARARNLERQSDTAMEIGLGDDMAGLTLLGGSTVLLGSDLLVAGVHFDPIKHSPSEIGRKAVLRCLSDCAAMAVRPVAALVSLLLPRGEVLSSGEAIMKSAFSAAAEFDCAIVGGDTASWPGQAVIDVMIAAQPWPEITPVRRDGARPGDSIHATGKFGGSILGKHMSFTPRVREAKQIAGELKEALHAMIDVSDGLSLDLHRLCTASGCGAILEEQALLGVVSPDAQRLADEDGLAPLEHAMGDGEDYELLMAVAPEVESKCRELDLELTCIGRFTEELGFQLRKSNNKLIDLEPMGYLH